MCTEVNSVMGLQATAATKRKREITFDSKDANTTYTSGPPPRKNGKWSLNSNSNSNSNNNNNNNNNNNYIDVINGETNGNANGSGDCKTNKVERLMTIEGAKGLAATTTAINSSSNNNNNNINNNNNNNNDSGKKGACSSSNCIGNTLSSAVVTKTSSINGIGKLVTSAGAPTKSDNNDTPLSPALTAPVLEDSIAKLEVVAAAPCEPWSSAVASNTEPVVDCISKLQAVAVPSDPWGSIATRSTLATTLLSADELDDDDDDFEDDYEEDESIIPTYCPLRYNPFSTGVSSSSSMLHQQQQQQRQQNGSYSPVLGYGSRPNYYSEPFPQQNCSRTGSAQHMRLGGASVNGFTAAWQSTSVSSGGSQQFYVSHESAYAPPQLQPPPPQQQTTIRCAENGKSYMELGCSSPPTNLPPVTSVTIVPPPPPTAFGGLHGPIGSAGVGLDVRHALKRCCDGRANWCSTGNANSNKNCYKEMRLKIRNLSMFKLSRFRQVSEQSLHRSVLICNTLKRIDREIEAEAKELHQAAAAAAAAAAQAQHMQYHQQQQMHVHLQNGGGGGASPLSHHNQTHLTQQTHQHPDYAPPVVNCARLAGIDYQLPLQQHGMSSVPQQSFQQQQQNYLGQPERLETASAPQTPYHLQKSTSSSFSLSSSSVVHCDVTSTPGAANSPSSSLPPYDHYPFRESQSGRATPFPCQPAMQTTSTVAASPATAPSTATAAITTAATSTAANAISATVTTTGTTTLTESDSGYADEDSTRSINWSSVLSLSAQSALDPLNNNDLFSILPPVTSVTNPATAVPVPLTALGIGCSSTTGTTASDATTAAATTSNRNVSVTCNSTTTYVSTSSNNNNHNGSNNNNSSSSSINVNTTAPPSQTSTTATFTTLSTISSATHSLTASYVSNMNAHAATSAAGNCSSTSAWEYGFLDMEFGLGSEFTELMPSCKLSSDDLFKSALTPVATSRYSSVVHDNELEQPAHIMVGS